MADTVTTRRLAAIVSADVARIAITFAKMSRRPGDASEEVHGQK